LTLEEALTHDPYPFHYRLTFPHSTFYTHSVNAQDIQEGPFHFQEPILPRLLDPIPIAHFVGGEAGRWTTPIVEGGPGHLLMILIDSTGGAHIVR
jgi:hypothetical protein